MRFVKNTVAAVQPTFNEVICLQAIDDFRRQQAQSDGLCSNGLSSYNFAEAALFVQNWATLYDKKVNLLLKHLIRLHSALCDVSTYVYT